MVNTLQLGSLGTPDVNIAGREGALRCSFSQIVEKQLSTYHWANQIPTQSKIGIVSLNSITMTCHFPTDGLGMIAINFRLLDVNVARLLDQIKRAGQSHYHCSIYPGTNYAGCISCKESRKELLMSLESMELRPCQGARQGPICFSDTPPPNLNISFEYKVENKSRSSYNLGSIELIDAEMIPS